MPDRRAWQTTPPRTALAWVAAAVGPEARIRAVHGLGTGIAQATHAVTVEDGDGGRHRLVLQRWIRPDWETEDPGFDPAKEASVLRVFATGPVPVPRVVAVDPDGAESGAPALLTERLPGRRPSASFTRRPDTLRTLGETLAALHRHAAAAVGRDPSVRATVPAYAPFGRLEDAVRPPGVDPARWRRALRDVAEAPASSGPATLIHRDYHAGNTLWIGRRLTGIVDWTSASWGPPAADLAHLRVDLVARGSVDAAVRVRTAYREAGGDLTDARHHQLRTVFDYLSDADPEHLVEPAASRLDAFLALVLDEPDP